MISPHQITAVNLVTATPLRRVPVQRAGFRLARAPDWVARIFNERALLVQVKTFNFLHTARWVWLGRFPCVDRDQPREARFGPRWVVYLGNYDGPWRPYFGAFMEAMSEGVYDIWGQSVGYPGFPAAGTANRLQAWLETRVPPSQHYYAAYPWATANDVRSAVRVRREVRSAALDLQARGTAEGERVTTVFDDLARRLRDCLGPIAPPAWHPPDEPAAILPDGRVRGFVAAFPVRRGEERQITDAIEALPRGTGSPFRRVPGTHFARLAVLDKETIGCHPDGKPVPVQSSYLLFAADYDAASPEDATGAGFVASVYEHMPDEVRAIWTHCYGFDAAVPGPGARFAALAEKCRRPILLEFMDCPDQSLGSVLDALRRHGMFVELVRRRTSRREIAARDLFAFL